MILQLDSQCLVRDEGTVIVLTGTDEQGRAVTFGADHRQARNIIEAASHGVIEAEVEGWQVLSIAKEGRST